MVSELATQDRVRIDTHKRRPTLEALQAALAVGARAIELARGGCAWRARAHARVRSTSGAT